ncbi:MAG: hypothetical protein RL217_2046 [Pseudomonadota bacterium]|jgi:lipid A 1-phosphatase
MSIKENYKKSWQVLTKPKLSIYALIVLFFVVAYAPVDNDFYKEKRLPFCGDFEFFTENYLRFSSTAIQIIAPILMRDPVGIAQSINASIATTLVTHSFKRLFNNQTTWDDGRRLGERPRSPKSKHNMPSGHSSMASLAVFYVMRRYGTKQNRFKIAMIYMAVIMACTMYTRVMLDDHTVPATLAGALVGLICAFVFTSPKEQDNPRASKEPS